MRLGMLCWRRRGITSSSGTPCLSITIRYSSTKRVLGPFSNHYSLFIQATITPMSTTLLILNSWSVLICWLHPLSIRTQPHDECIFPKASGTTSTPVNNLSLEPSHWTMSPWLTNSQSSWDKVPLSSPKTPNSWNRQRIWVTSINLLVVWNMINPNPLNRPSIIEVWHQFYQSRTLTMTVWLQDV